MAEAVDQKLLKRTKFPPEFTQKVDMRKVNIEVMKKWIAGRIAEILGTEDDIVTELCFNLLEGERFPNIKVLQIQLTGFLDKDTAGFCKELWSLCLSAQANPQGVPKELLEAKKLELIQEKLEAEKAAEAVRRQRQQDRGRDRDMDDVRRRERAERGRGRGRGREAYRGRGDRDFDRRPARRSPSPHSRRGDFANDRGPPPRRGDTYVPADTRRRRKSPALSISASRSRSRTPPRRRRRSLSSSRSPPRRRHRSSSLPRSISRDRVRRRNSVTRAPPSPSREKNARSPSPRRPRSHQHHRRLSPSVSRSRSRSRSPPPKRRRRSYSASRSRSPPARARRRLTRSPPRRRSSSVESHAAKTLSYGKTTRQTESSAVSESVSKSPQSHRRRRNSSSS